MDFVGVTLFSFSVIIFPRIAGPTSSVDESMIWFKGPLEFHQYIPMKPIKWGVKVWMLTQSKTGYVDNFQI